MIEIYIILRRQLLGWRGGRNKVDRLPRRKGRHIQQVESTAAQIDSTCKRAARFRTKIMTIAFLIIAEMSLW